MGKYRANFVHREKWWVGWTDDVPGALTQGETLDEVRENLRDAIRLMQKQVPVDELPEPLPSELIQEVIEA
ncbi:MAG: type II toxin-antitoxin system HicB family antitoxin [Planctomycetia bacterium]|nr:type II toxin-antitoxin system HicB family antitoxin [Planctomycetia bacterium]